MFPSHDTLAKEGKIHPAFNTPEILKRKANEEKYFGEWFTKDKNDLDWYKKDREFKDPEIIQLNVPKTRLKEFQNYDKTLSRAPDREFIVPKNLQKEFLNKTDDVVKPAISIADDVTKQTYKTTWQLEELPGLHLKSTMTDGAISKIIEPKTGLVNVEQALAIIGKESGGADKVALVRQGLGKNIVTGKQIGRAHV